MALWGLLVLAPRSVVHVRGWGARPGPRTGVWLGPWLLELVLQAPLPLTEGLRAAHPAARAGTPAWGPAERGEVGVPPPPPPPRTSAAAAPRRWKRACTCSSPAPTAAARALSSGSLAASGPRTAACSTSPRRNACSTSPRGEGRRGAQPLPLPTWGTCPRQSPRGRGPTRPCGACARRKAVWCACAPGGAVWVWVCVGACA